jgi:hypothetical protein
MPNNQTVIQLYVSSQKLERFNDVYQEVMAGMMMSDTVDWEEQIAHQTKFENIIQQAKLRIQQSKAKITVDIAIAAMEDITEEVVNLQANAKKAEGGLTPMEAVQANATFPDQLKVYEEYYQTTVREVDEASRTELRANRVFRKVISLRVL